ncbi:MAG: 3-oxoacyl-ACP synthase [Bacteroidetes bacterium]|nr:3-oxoacyl-ACP synthase [Bacteroidota bacterium]
MDSIKEQLYRMCVDYVQKRINEARQAIADAQEAADEETKSSAGDKYETGREMMQQETGRNQVQLNEANKLMVQLSSISYSTTSSSANPGSLVDTNLGKFFIAISAGTLNLGSQTYYAVSPVSPIGIQLHGKKAGDEFSLNGREYRVEKVA